jgi:peroxiredoxin
VKAGAAFFVKTKSLILLVLATALVYFIFLNRHEGGSLVGGPAPEFTLPDRKESHQSKDYRGRWVLLNFWASWCPPCIHEMPSLEALQKRFKDKKFEILAISVDEAGWPAVDRLLARVPVDLRILLDARGDIAERYGVFQLPHTYLIDPAGRLVKEYSGPRDWMSPGILSEIETYVESP